MIVAGIDEAGLGPVLGPLVVSAAAFDVPDEAADGDLWSHLSGCVARKSHRRGGGPIAVADSKKLYSRKRPAGLAPLERGVLCMLACLQAGEGESNSQSQPSPAKTPETFAELLSAVAPAAAGRAAEYPWYDRCELPLPHHAGQTDVMLTGNSLKVGLRKANVALRGLRAEPVFVREYNRLVAATHNKSTTAFDVTCRMLMWLWQSAGCGHIRITVDRQGGRVRYRQPLQRVFTDCELKVLDESARRSAYLLRRGDKTAEVDFVVGGESQSLPTALASMLSKYLRELFMECFNRYWAGHVADIDPTAGYYTDGRRFYGQIAEAMGRLGIAEDRVYRSR